jgi:integrase/recombinase XerD
VKADEALSLFKSYLNIEKGYSENTVLSYSQDIRQLFGWVKLTSTSQISVEVIHNYLLALKKREYSKRSLNRKLASLSSFFKYLQREQIINENFAVHIEYPKLGQRLPKVLSKKNIETIIHSDMSKNYSDDLFQVRDKAMLMLLYYAGLRVSEVISIPLRNVNLNEGVVRVRGKGDKERLIPLVKDVIPTLRAYCEAWMPISRKTFFSKKNGEMLTRQRVWSILKVWVKSFGITDRITPHMLRHTFATQLLENNVDLRYIQEMLGHSNISTTEIYTVVSKSRLHTIFDECHPRD